MPAAAAGALALSVYPDGTNAPAAPTSTVPLRSAACAVSGAERLCTLVARARPGSLDIAAGAGALHGTALRVALPESGGNVSLAFDGVPARWSFRPALLVSVADGASHQIPFAVSAQDAAGFILLHDAPQPPAAVRVAGDRLGQLDVVAQGAGEFVARYAGRPVGAVTLSAAAPGAAAATANFTALSVNPASLQITPGKSAVLDVGLAHYAGAFQATALGPCSVVPRSATPARDGASVAFTVTLQSGAGCSVAVSAAPLDVPIVIPAKNAVAYPGLGVGPSKIRHVVVMLQENRSFDTIFGGLDDNGKPFPGADTVSNPNPGENTPHNHLGQPVPMSTGLLEECYDPLHYHPNAVTDIDGGKMNGFDHEFAQQENCAPSPAPTNYVYRTLEYAEVSPYWQMGERYAISDRMFEPLTSASYGPHLFLVSGQSADTIDNPNGDPWGCDNETGVVTVIDQATGGEKGAVAPCFTVPTLGDVLDQRGVSWRYYATARTDFGYNWSAFASFEDIRFGPDWSEKVINPPAQIITDVGNGELAAMTWVTPTNATSDHPQSHSNLGPAWITSVVNAIGQSQFWDSTAIFITWDDWGGWYDHVSPPVTGPVSLGIRVPVIVISPYVRSGYVSHGVHTTGSILHFAEEVFDLPSLGEEDARRDDFMDAFDFTQSPTRFAPFAQTRSKAEIMRAASQSTRPPPGQSAGD